MQRMQRIFDKAGIPLGRFNAIDHKQVPVHPARALIPTRHRFRDWSLSELGCLLSHYEIWQNIAAGPDPFAAVFEDDVHIDGPELRRFLESEIPEAADVIKLETFMSPVVTAPFRGRLQELRSLHTGSAGYVISRRAARSLAERPNLFDMPVDHVLFEPGHPANANLLRLQHNPALVAQDCVLPPGQSVGGFLNSNMSDRPAFGAAPRPPRGSFFDRAARAPKTIWKIVSSQARTRLLSRGSIVPFSGNIER